MNVTFSDRELLDLGAAWVVLSVAFTILIATELWPLQTDLLGLSFVTVGVAFLLHELAHKVVAIRLGKVAEFRADYGMLFVAVMSALVGFFFAAPGAVYHRGESTPRQNGIIALAGPITNLVLAALFVPLLFLPAFLGSVGRFGVGINVFLAGFNMLPVGPLDGKTVLRWNKPVFVSVFVPSIGLALYALVRLFL